MNKAVHKHPKSEHIVRHTTVRKEDATVMHKAAHKHPKSEHIVRHTMTRKRDASVLQRTSEIRHVSKLGL